jgi:hypothetical protein
MKEKLVPGLAPLEIEQTSLKFEPIRFREEDVNKVKKEKYTFGKNRCIFLPFKVSKDTHQKGLR